jgi:hypothetical protein
MVLRKERDRLKEIDTELIRIKKDLLLIDRSLESLNKVKTVKFEKPAPAPAKGKGKAPAKGRPALPQKKAGPKPKAKKKSR